MTETRQDPGAEDAERQCKDEVLDTERRAKGERVSETRHIVAKPVRAQEYNRRCDEIEDQDTGEASPDVADGIGFFSGVEKTRHQEKGRDVEAYLGMPKLEVPRGVERGRSRDTGVIEYPATGLS